MMANFSLVKPTIESLLNILVAGTGGDTIFTEISFLANLVRLSREKHAATRS
jgi:hypothetical protein